ncbi:hypothetical protein Tco_1195078 [Tanacetum coccineum]
MPILNDHITVDIQEDPYYNEYLEKVAKHQRYLDGEEGSDPDSPAPKPAKSTKPVATKKSKPSAPKAAPAPSRAKRTKAGKVVKKQTQKSSLWLEDKFVGESVPVNEPKFGDEEADIQKAVKESLMDVHTGDEETGIQKAVEESLKDAFVTHQGPLPPVVIREPESGKYKPLSEVYGKGKEKVGEELAA